jgi:NAD(P)-dependent dehydrogenase (short-subunit alcohol dehydrogenase family)
MDPQVQRTVLVTGATGLLGRQVVKEFSIRGWTVKGTGFSRADGKDVIKLDFAEEAAIERVLDDIKSVHPRQETAWPLIMLSTADH